MGAKRLALSLGLCATGGLIVLDWLYGDVRFVNPACNYFALFLALWTPAAVGLALMLSPSRKARIMGLAFLLPAVATVFLSTFVAQDLLGILHRGGDTSFLRLYTLPAGRYRVAVFRTDGGATTDYGVVVRQEKAVLPGVVKVKTLHSRYRATDARVEVMDGSRVRCEYISLGRKLRPPVMLELDGTF